MDKIKNAINKLIDVSSETKIIDEFAHKKFNEKYFNTLESKTWRVYSGFEILSNNKLKIKVIFQNFDESFIVDLKF